MLKMILSLFGIVGDATPEQTEKTRTRIKKALKKADPGAEKYTPLYGYGMKNSLNSTTMYSYAVGYSPSSAEILIVEIDSESEENGNAFSFNKENTKKIKSGMQGDYIFKSDNMKNEIKVFIPGFTKENAENTYQLPIDQKAEVVEFAKFIKDNF